MKLYLCCTGLSSGIVYSLCYWEKPRFLECNVLYLMMCGMFSLQGGLDTVHMFQSLMFFLLLHSKTKNDFMLKNSWEWKDNHCLYWMKLPNPGSVAHNHAVTMDLGTPEPLIGATVTSSIHHILWCWWQRLPLKLEITLEQPLFMPRLFHNTFNFLD